MRHLFLLTLAGLALATGSARAQAGAEPDVTLSSSVLIGHQTRAADGRTATEWRAPDKVMAVPGDRVRFTMRYENRRDVPVASFRAVNPLPSAVAFRSVEQDWAELSVDGGKSWGKLSQLKVRATDLATGSSVERPASADDVTHIRWSFAQPIPAHGTGELGYEGVIR